MSTGCQRDPGANPLGGLAGIKSNKPNRLWSLDGHRMKWA